MSEEIAEREKVLLARITRDPGKLGGKPCIRHKRIRVSDILGWLGAGMSEQEILEDYPELTTEDIRAALVYAANRLNHPNVIP